MGNMHDQGMEKIIETFSSLSIKEKSDKFDPEEKFYTYKGTILNIKIRQNSPTKIYFKAVPSRCFWWPHDEEIPEFAQIGSMVKVIYQEIVVKTYAHFWIEKFEEVENPATNRRKYSFGEKSPKIKCNKCEQSCLLSNFTRCDGIIEKGFFGSYCNICQSSSDGKNIGQRCVRESTTCDNCGYIRTI